MNIHCEKGDKILLTDTCSQTFCGVVRSINLDLGRVVLSDVILLPQQKPLTGYRNFDKDEILDIKKYKVEESDSEEAVQKIEEIKLSKPVPMSTESKCEIIKKNQNEYRYIRDFGSNFHTAISLLKTCSKIGVYGKDTSKGRFCRISVMAISTPTNIFVFDLQVLGDEVLEKGLKEILESPDIIKVVYDSRLLSDCLKHKHLINLENVRDIEAEDIMVVFQDRRMIRRHSRSLEYLSYVYLGLEVGKCLETGEVWNQRPLPNNLLNVLVSCVSVLIPIQAEIELKYLQKLIDASNIYNNHFRNLDFYDFLIDEPKKTLRHQIAKILVPQNQTRTDYRMKQLS